MQAVVELFGRRHEWQFILADIQFLILGIDFLQHHNLLVDVVDHKPLPKTAVTAAAVADPVPVDVQELLSKFPALAAPLSAAAPPAQGVEHHIVTAGQPAMAKFHEIPSKCRKSVPQANGLVERSISG
jgi:hypothetical protein